MTSGTLPQVAFLGVGNMGGPMARNLIRAGHSLSAYDLAPTALDAMAAAGARLAPSIAEAVDRAAVIVSMLPAGPHVQEAYSGAGGVLAHAPADALLIDCSTIDVVTARAVAAEAASRGYTMLDAPVSGGVMGAEAATLTFMVGGTAEGFARAEPILARMGKAVVHAGGPGNGQAAKICNNMLLGISMIGVSESFALAERLGLDAQKLFDIASKSSGQCWSLTTYCPVPGPVPTSPANRDYRPGFTAAMMAKDLRLAQAASQAVGATTPLGAQANAIYDIFCKSGHSGVDFSGIVLMLTGKTFPNW